MKSIKKHIYFVPGTAANTQIFERIVLPEDQFELHFIEWIVPESKNETIASYAARLSKRIKHPNPILVGVSFGGVMVQEISKLVPCEKIVLISSIKSKFELSKALRIIRDIKAYKLFPSSLLTSLFKTVSSFSGKQTKRRIQQYEKYLSVRNPLYLNWAIKQVLQWKQTKALPNTLHIHGTNDFIFPIQHIANCLPIDKGTHVMIISKAHTISRILTKELV